MLELSLIICLELFVVVKDERPIMMPIRRFAVGRAVALPCPTGRSTLEDEAST